MTTLLLKNGRAAWKRVHAIIPSVSFAGDVMVFTHHYIFGTLTDFLTGEKIQDTHDERFRQDIAKSLVEEKGYDKQDIRPGVDIFAKADIKTAVVKLDFLIYLENKAYMLIKYGPGSIITRHRPGIAASRLVEPYQIPVVVVTNGVDADILDGKTSKITGSGLDNIPDKKTLLGLNVENVFPEIMAKRAEMESRILYTFEIEDSCETNCML